ncbi:response regulator [Dyadobacter sp. CY345]|uniref:response regulator n=1 Tax=Dyadobacter sp. CY345 TaxID=2909335 RepID=UPI001F39DD6F|nr:response regulator [Dyadobacter sp. CY345]MCF2444762.1 response regulator [Dyadobacter sp. CY345]
MQRILLIDDGLDMHSGLKKLFEGDGHKNLLIEKVESAADGLKKITNNSYSVVIVNLAIPNTDMLGLIKRIRAYSQTLPILAYSKILEYTLIKRYLTSGVNGYCFYRDDDDEILKACQTIISGRWFISPEMISLIVEDALYNKKTDRFESLSEREFEIFSHLVKDESPAAIADILSLHISAIALYKSRIMDKLMISSLVEMKNLMKTPVLA